MDNKNLASVSKIDRFLLNAFPNWGARRIQNKANGNALMQSGAFEPARRSDRPYVNLIKSQTSPDSRTDFGDLAELRDISRALVMTSIGGGITQRLTDHVIGNGITYKASVDADALKLTKEAAKIINKKLTDIWDLFFYGQLCHYERTKTGGELMASAFKSMLEGGDSWPIPVKVNRKGFPFPFALQLFEAELVNNPNRLSNNDTLSDGVYTNINGVPIQISVSNKYPNIFRIGETRETKWETKDIYNTSTGVRQVYQLSNFIQDRPGAKRGIPYLTPVSGIILDIKTLNENILAASGIQASFAGLLKGSSGNKLANAPTNKKESKTSDDFAKINFKKGQLIDFRGQPSDLTLEFLESKQTGKDFNPFYMDNLGILSTITGVPRSIILMIFGQNFSASRGEVALFWTTVLRFRYAFVFQFLQPFQEYLFTWAVLSGMADLPGFLDDPFLKKAYLGNPIHQFSGPRMVSIDPKKEADGFNAQINAGIKSRQGIIRTSSEDDPEDVFRELEEEKDRGLGQSVADQTRQILDNNSQQDDGNADDETD